MNLKNPSPSEVQEIIIHISTSYKPDFDQLKILARVINEEPSDIYPVICTRKQALDLLVERAAQTNSCEKLLENVELLLPSTQSNQFLKRPLEIKNAQEFGEIFEELINRIENIDLDEGSPVGANDFTEFETKLKVKAKFSPSMQSYAKLSKMENSVLQRTAKKLGFSKYPKIKKKVMRIYLNLLASYPSDQFTADQRYKILLNVLFEILSKDTQSIDEVEERLAGIIFDTTYDCLIFNE
ncbi:hypothetical protein CBW65_19570 [Tumebacillus avium]|uniref:Uncharacterized protein n=1 Tax=Tumebacillus avium TaxID=1903704 RepID=A0A1Y0IUC4_9BACL|nr:hypothetical protein [Tumebacillus avium]ARU62934.1 hypothetical protein CBW65_19570 [Tumebacillus avium]